MSTSSIGRIHELVCSGILSPLRFLGFERDSQNKASSTLFKPVSYKTLWHSPIKTRVQISRQTVPLKGECTAFINPPIMITILFHKKITSFSEIITEGPPPPGLVPQVYICILYIYTIYSIIYSIWRYTVQLHNMCRLQGGGGACTPCKKFGFFTKQN